MSGPLLTLEEAAGRPVAEVGGKARTLGRLRRAGFPVPEGFVIPIGASLAAALAQLGPLLAAGPQLGWAVRSSAADEDSSSASYAGQYTTFLDVPPAEVAGCAARCRAAAGAGISAYRTLAGADAQGQAAVIIQRMAPGGTAGIAFTADPRTGQAGQIWIEMVPGRGSTAADGTGSSRLVRLNRPGLDLAPGGPPSLLPPAALQSLGQMALAVEKALGGPQDIEWAYGEGQLFLLQARPLTTASQGWTRANVAEIFPEPVTPLTWSILQGFLAGRREASVPLARLIGGRVYLRRDLVRRSFEWLLVIDSLAVERALGDEPGEGMDWRRFFRPDYWAATGLFLADFWGLTHRLEGRVGRFLAASRPAVLEAGSALADCLASLEDWQAWTAAAFSLHLYTTTYAIAASRLAGRTAGGGIATRSARMGRRLWELSGQARRLGLEPDFLSGEPLSSLPGRLAASPVGAAWLAGFESFMAEFGGRCANEFELITPRWSETPAVPLGMIQAYLSGPAEAGRAPAGGDAAPVSAAGNRFGRLSAQREEMKHAVAEGYAALRRGCLQAGELLRQAGRLEQAADIFFLTDGEVRRLAGAGGSFAERVTLRRGRWHNWQRAGALPASSGGLAGGRLAGIGVSPGVVGGPARVVRSLEGAARLAPGEVLVLPNADPAWTPLFLQAAAVVCDAGGLLSHSATVAREFGIPAVFNTGEAVRCIRDGQVIIVNADEGWVEL